MMQRSCRRHPPAPRAPSRPALVVPPPSLSSRRTTTTLAKTLHAAKHQPSTLSLLCELSKARLSALVVLSSSAGFLLAGPPFALDKLVLVTLGTSLAAASASSFNQIYESKTDALMLRTRHRPIPAGHVTVPAAVGLGVGAGLASVTTLALGTNPLTAGLGLANIGLYSAVYTPLKQKSTWNTWIGALVGAIPPLMGYAAATGTIFALPPVMLSAGLFFWQFPHFFALAWLYKDDYSRGGHVMIPVVDASGARTGRILTSYAVANSAVPVACYLGGVTSIMFPLESLAFNAYMIWACRKFQRKPNDENARRVFRSSLWYLPLFMGTMVFHSQADRRSEQQADLLTWPANIDGARAYMRDVFCLHERVVSARASEETAKNAHEGFCPVTTLEHTRAVAGVIQGAGGNSAAAAAD